MDKTSRITREIFSLCYLEICVPQTGHVYRYLTIMICTLFSISDLSSETSAYLVLEGNSLMKFLGQSWSFESVKKSLIVLLLLIMLLLIKAY